MGGDGQDFFRRSVVFGRWHVHNLLRSDRRAGKLNTDLREAFCSFVDLSDPDVVDFRFSSPLLPSSVRFFANFVCTDYRPGARLAEQRRHQSQQHEHRQMVRRFGGSVLGLEGDTLYRPRPVDVLTRSPLRPASQLTTTFLPAANRRRLFLTRPCERLKFPYLLTPYCVVEQPPFSSLLVTRIAMPGRT